MFKPCEPPRVNRHVTEEIRGHVLYSTTDEKRIRRTAQSRFQKVPVLSSNTLTLWCVCPTVTSVLFYHPIAHPSQQFGTDIILAASSHSPATSACASSNDSSFAVQGTFPPSRAILVVRCIHCQCWKVQQSVLMSIKAALKQGSNQVRECAYLAAVSIISNWSCMIATPSPTGS
jgi:hypothetical protein